MKVPVWILTLLTAAGIAVQSWVLSEVVALKVNVAKLDILVTRLAANGIEVSRSAFQSAENKHQKKEASQ